MAERPIDSLDGQIEEDGRRAEMGKICARIKFASPLGSPHVARVASFLLSTPERKSMRQRGEVGLSEGVTHSAMVELSIPASQHPCFSHHRRGSWAKAKATVHSSQASPAWLLAELNPELGRNFGNGRGTRKRWAPLQP